MRCVLFSGNPPYISGINHVMIKPVFFYVFAVLTFLTACGPIQPDPPPPTSAPPPASGAAGSEEGSLIDRLFGGSAPSEGGAGIGVNFYLWRASLDTLSFMPLSQTDPFGGVINYDWYTPPATPGERLKVIIYILDKQLRADGLRVAVFRQKLENAAWIQAEVDPKTVRDLENAILKRAREMRIASKNVN